MINKSSVKTVNNFETSVSLFKEGKFAQALEEINKAIQTDGSNLEFYFFRARVFSRLGKFADSLEDYDRLSEQDPYNPTYISDRAVVLHLLKRNEEALAEFDRALNLEPKNPYRYSSRAYFKDRIGDHKGALEDYEKAIELDPDDAVAYNNKGLVEEKMGYIKRSKKSFEKSEELIGYKRPETPKVSPETEPKARQELPEIEMEPMEESPKKVTLQSYIKTSKDVLTDEKTRKDFWDFLKSKIGSRKS